VGYNLLRGKIFFILVSCNLCHVEEIEEVGGKKTGGNRRSVQGEHFPSWKEHKKEKRTIKESHPKTDNETM